MVAGRSKSFEIGLQEAMDGYAAACGSLPRRTLEATPLSQHFETLDAQQALCLESWPLKNGQGLLKRWTRLVKEGANWRVKSVEEGILSKVTMRLR